MEQRMMEVRRGVKRKYRHTENSKTSANSTSYVRRKNQAISDGDIRCYLRRSGTDPKNDR